MAFVATSVFSSFSSADEFSALKQYMEGHKADDIATALSLLPNASSYYSNVNIDGEDYKVTYQKVATASNKINPRLQLDTSSTEVCINVKIDGEEWEICARKKK